MGLQNADPYHIGRIDRAGRRDRRSGPDRQAKPKGPFSQPVERIKPQRRIKKWKKEVRNAVQKAHRLSFHLSAYKIGATILLKSATSAATACTSWLTAHCSREPQFISGPKTSHHPSDVTTVRPDFARPPWRKSGGVDRLLKTPAFDSASA